MLNSSINEKSHYYDMPYTVPAEFTAKFCIL